MDKTLFIPIVAGVFALVIGGVSGYYMSDYSSEFGRPSDTGRESWERNMISELDARGRETKGGRKRKTIKKRV